MNKGMKKTTLALFIVIAGFMALAWLPSFLELSGDKDTPTIGVVFTQQSDEEDYYENILQVSQFAFDRFNASQAEPLDANLVSLDHRLNERNAVQDANKLIETNNVIAFIGPLFSNVAMALKPVANGNQIPLVSNFATHNDLTKDSRYVFRICASNDQLISALVNKLKPIIKEHKLNVTVYKDVSDSYSVDLADSFRQKLGKQVPFTEISFRGADGLTQLRDLNTQAWKPSKKDVLFFPVRDLIAGKILTYMETQPYMVTAVDTVNFLPLMKKIKSHKTHIRIITTSQWIPDQSKFSNEIQIAFAEHFKRPMTIVSALTFDAAWTVAHAMKRAAKNKVTLRDALVDGTPVTGVTGKIIIGKDGNRVFSKQFFREEIVK